MTQPPRNPFEDLMKMGQDWANAMGPMLENMTPQGFEALWPTMPKEVMETFWGKTYNPEGLEAKTKLLLTVHGLTILGAQAEAQLRLTIRHAIEAGATEQEITETISLAGMFGGMPAMAKAMTLAREVLSGTEASGPKAGQEGQK